jgi:hypothetical protein
MSLISVDYRKIKHFSSRPGGILVSRVTPELTLHGGFLSALDVCVAVDLVLMVDPVPGNFTP